ncbi:unnamed protein product [Gongylonema pulchrum]|uniref:Ras-GEF domain-containing protein n=1 Tax=Gongylonema pulchrum TaxID=637853 RepID=A0A183D1A3_9BILA|nr:unnamed protein product [Gongylonema pulchrum]
MASVLTKLPVNQRLLKAPQRYDSTQIDQPALNLFARDFYILLETQEERLAYMTLIRDVLLLLDARVDVSTRDADEILRFETDLANQIDHPSDEEDIKSKNGKPIVVNDTTEVVIYGLEFIGKLDDLLPKYETRIIINYLSWCWFFKAMLRDLPDPFALTMFKFYRSLNLMQVPKMRWHGCVTRINSLMPMATSSIYIRNHFDNEAKKQASEQHDLDCSIKI